MAARENQGYLIAVILLVLLSVILAISTYFGFTKMNEYADQRDNLQTRLTNKENETKAFESQTRVLKAYLGGIDGYSVAEVPTYLNAMSQTGQADIQSETDRITEIYSQDMARYNNKPEGVDGSWRGLMDNLGDALQEMHANQAILLGRINSTETDRTTQLAAKDKVIAEKEEALSTSQRDLQAEKAARAADLAELNDKLNNIQVMNNQLNGEKQAMQSQFDQQRQALELERDDAVGQVTVLEDRLFEYEKLEEDVADGQIVSISNALGTITLNLGYEDNLRIQQTFEVHDRSATKFKMGSGKASVEVIDILGPHLARARIIGQSTTDPILRNDFVVTTTWDPGYAVPVALAGLIDIDGDGVSDLERMISIVNQSGGKVVAYHDIEGHVTGAIDQHTRYFVRGGEPIDINMGQGYKNLEDQRNRYRTREVSVREFLKSMGFNSEARIQRLDHRIGDTLRFREPPTRPGNGAFNR